MKNNDYRYIETINNIRKALVNGNNNAVGELLECSSAKGFLVEMNSHDRQYYVKIRVDADMEWVIMEIHPNITVGEPYMHMFNEYAMKKSREKKVGNIRIGAGNTAEIYLSTSFTSGPITVEEYERMERIAIQFTISVEDQLDMLAHGIMPKQGEKSKEDEIKEALEHFLKNGVDDEAGDIEEEDFGEEDSDEEEDTQPGDNVPFSDFLEFLAAHASMETDDDESFIDVDTSDEEMDV